MKKKILSAAFISMFTLTGCNPTIQQLGTDLLQNTLTGLTGTDTSGNTSGTTGTVSALLGGLLEGVLGNSTLTEQNILGTWTYSGSSVDGYLTNLGFNQNTCQFTFNADKTFNGMIAGKRFSGNYTLNTNKNTLKLTYLAGLSHTAVHVALNGGKLSLLFDADKFKTILSTLGTLSGNSTVSTLTNLLGSYDGMLVGLELRK